MLFGLKMSVIVIMPAYNAARTLKVTYDSIPMDVVDKIILTDDVSQGVTAQIDPLGRAQAVNEMRQIKAFVFRIVEQALCVLDALVGFGGRLHQRDDGKAVLGV